MELRSEDYATEYSDETFLSFETLSGRLAGYLRLSLPKAGSGVEPIKLEIPEIEGAALVREVHVYGPALALGASGKDQAVQHTGIGRRLLAEAERCAHKAGYSKMAIIASVGTRGYYAKYGYELEGTYMVRSLG
jgi:elongator complex protein 3